MWGRISPVKPLIKMSELVSPRRKTRISTSLLASGNITSLISKFRSFLTSIILTPRLGS